MVTQVDKLTKEFKQHDGNFLPDETIVKDKYAKIEDNLGFKRCMHCGTSLPPNEDGSPKWRRQPEACVECVWRNK